MPPARTAVLGSLVINVCVLGSLLFSMPGVRNEFDGQERVAVGVQLLMFALLFAVPWLTTFAQAGSAKRVVRSFAFALISVCALLLLIPVISAPAEGVVYYVVFYVAVVWVTFAVVALGGA